MTDAQKRFCDEYLIDLNATRAYKVAYPNCKKDATASQAGSRLLRNVKVQEYVTERIKDRESRTEITQDMVILELAQIAFFNVKDIYSEDGNLKKIAEIDDNVAKAISSVKVQQRAGAMKIEVNPNGKDKEIPIEHIAERTVEYKTNDKVKALELLGKHFGMFKENVSLSQDKPFEVNINIKKKR